MQPIPKIGRPERMLRVQGPARAMLALTLAIGAITVPVYRAVACSCGFAGYEEAIAAADVAFIGTVVARDEPPPFGEDIMLTARHAFDVTRSKAPMQSPFSLEVAAGGGASCGLEMSIGEEWVVIASEWDDKLQTNLCSGTVLAESLDQGELGRIEHALPENHRTASAPTEDGIVIPAPIVVAGAAALLVALVSLLAFRRDRIR
jgi:hypothetical protein